MRIDMKLVREILKKLYTAPSEKHPFPDESHLLSPPSIPGYENQSDIVGDHVDLMVSCGLIERERVGMKPPPDFVGLKPTSDARKWFDCSLDNAKWEEVSEELEERLKKCQSE
jgi:hypothetical protein